MGWIRACGLQQIGDNEMVGLDIAKFNTCFDSRKYKDEIEGDRADGIAAGVTGTPSFFINGRPVEGALPFEKFQPVIEQELATKK